MTRTIIAEAWNETKDAAVANSPIEIIESEWAGVELEPVQVLELDAGAGRPILFESHKRGTNWTALLSGKNAAQMDRDFRRYQNSMFDYSTLSVGDTLEIGADYTSGGGVKHRSRTYIVVVAVTDERLFFAYFDTAAQAMKAARVRAKNVAATASVAA